MKNFVSRFCLNSLIETTENLNFIYFYFGQFENSLQHIEVIGFYDKVEINGKSKLIVVSKYSISEFSLPKPLKINSNLNGIHPRREMINGIFFPLHFQNNLIDVYRGFKPFPKAGHGIKEQWQLVENQYRLINTTITWRS